MHLALQVGLPAIAQSEPGRTPDEQEVLSGLNRLGEQFQQLGSWDEQVPQIAQAMEGIWARAGWNSEEDQFALSLAGEVAAIPPWQIDRRIDKVVECLAGRYELSTPAQARLKRSAYRETMGLLWGNAGVIFDQAGQWIRLSASGEPVTPELVAEWTRQNEPLVGDFRRRAGTFLEELGGTVAEGHRAQFEQDLEAFTHRREYFARERERWANGEWKPQDWGMQDGLLFRKPADAAGGPTSRPTGAGLAASPASRALSYDPSTWHWYVEDFIEHYALDPGQAAAANSILSELVQRASVYMKARADDLAKVPLEERETHAGFAPVRALFEELKVRLERIPRTGQQKSPSAGEGPQTPPPAQSRASHGPATAGEQGPQMPPPT